MKIGEKKSYGSRPRGLATGRRRAVEDIDRAISLLQSARSARLHGRRGTFSRKLNRAKTVIDTVYNRYFEGQA